MHEASLVLSDEFEWSTHMVVIQTQIPPTEQYQSSCLTTPCLEKEQQQIKNLKSERKEGEMKGAFERKSEQV